MNQDERRSSASESQLSRSVKVSALAVLTCALSMPAAADLQIIQETKLRADGFLSILAADIQSTTSMSGDKAKTVSKQKSKNAMMRMFGGDQEQISIIRLDKGLSWDVRPSDKEYSEIELSSLGEQFEAMNQRISEARGGAGNGAAPVASDEACTLSAARVSVEESGKSKKIAGLLADQIVIKVEQTCELPERDQICEIRQTWESWLARDFPAGAEMKSFYEEFSRQTNLMGGSMNQTSATAMFADMFGDAWEAASEKAGSLEGFPLQSEIKLEFGGEKCEGLAELRAASAELVDAAAEAGMDGAMDEAATQAGEETANQTAGMFGDSPLEKIAGAGVGRAAGEMVSGIFGGLKNMTKKNGEKGAPDENHDTVFEIRTVVKEVKTKAVSKELFDLPQGYKRIEIEMPF